MLREERMAQVDRDTMNKSLVGCLRQNIFGHRKKELVRRRPRMLKQVEGVLATEILATKILPNILDPRLVYTDLFLVLYVISYLYLELYFILCNFLFIFRTLCK